jgi:hypothetical protein
MSSFQPNTVAPVTTGSLNINKTAAGMNHDPPGNPVTVTPGGTVTACNLRAQNTRLKVTMAGRVTFDKVLRPDECVTLTVGSPQLPNGNYKVKDPPAILKIIGTKTRPTARLLGTKFTFT